MFQPFQSSADVCTVNALICKRKREKMKLKHDETGQEGPCSLCPFWAWGRGGRAAQGSSPKDCTLWKPKQKAAALSWLHKLPRRRLWLAQPLLGLHQKSLLEVVGVDGEWDTQVALWRMMRNLQKGLKEKAQHSQLQQNENNVLLCSLDSDIGRETIFWLWKRQTNPTYINQDLLQGKKNQNKFLKVPIIFTGQKVQKKII